LTGVGRLVLDICAKGYEVQGNEFSLHMLLASDFMLNGGHTPQKQFSIFPWLSETSNINASSDPTSKVLIPDVYPAELLNTGKYDGKINTPKLSMAAGDFVSIYSDPKECKKWNCVASCFFLDTAPNIIAYLDVIYNMLEDNGILINLGPLLYHWAGPKSRPDDLNSSGYKTRYSSMDERYLRSIEMSWEDVRTLVQNIGFEILQEKIIDSVKYTANVKSLLSHDYRCIFFVAQKKVII